MMKKTSEDLELEISTLRHELEQLKHGDGASNARKVHTAAMAAQEHASNQEHERRRQEFLDKVMCAARRLNARLLVPDVETRQRLEWIRPWISETIIEGDVGGNRGWYREAMNEAAAMVKDAYPDFWLNYPSGVVFSIKDE